MTTFRRAALVCAGALIATAACTNAETAAPPAPTSQAATAVSMTDQWVKAAPDGMTALFGTLRNSSGAEVSLVSATSPAAGRVELHEVVNQGATSAMRPKAGGFAIPAGGTHVLAPGGDHIMLMDLKEPLKVGADVEVTLTLSDGSTVPVSAQVRDYAGAAETYQPDGHSAGGHG